jgi:hypothetical protein
VEEIDTRGAVDARAGRRSSGRACRDLDPIFVAQIETEAWMAYYRRRWLTFARLGVLLARRQLRLSWPLTFYCAWLVLRANQLWAPYPANNALRAERAMQRFYRLLGRRSGEAFDPSTAARLEVDWWRIHRELQHGRIRKADALGIALARLYAHIYGLPEATLRGAGDARARAMQSSDRWVLAGCPAHSPLILEVRDALIDSYEALLRAVAAAPMPAQTPGAPERVTQLRRPLMPRARDAAA